jgi:hypothetical protein
MILTGHIPWSFPAPLAAAGRALIVLDVLRLRRGDPDTLAMEPLLADVAADPELAIHVSLPAGGARVCLLLLLLRVFLAIIFFVFWLNRLCRLAVRIGVS